MSVGSIKENISLEKRVAITPESAKNIIALGLNISLEKNYAVHLGVEDNQYENLGVKFFNSPSEVINNSKLVKRRGKVYVINKKNPRYKARQG